MVGKKRNAVTAAATDGPARLQKRRRLEAYVPETDETAENTTIAGLQVIETIRQTKDKHGRLIAGEFERLPDPNSAPSYYRAILLPISLEMVENRLKNHEYRQLTHVEADLRRLVSNAKHYNENGSTLFSNAERIRKVLAAEFPKLNPAYNDPNYVPFSTPVPADVKPPAIDTPQLPNAASGGPSEEQPGTPYLRTRRRATATATPTATTKPHAAGKPDENAEEKEGYEGLGFEAAQAKLISEMMKLKDETGLEVFYNFLSKPDKNLYKEYYDIIKHPVSLRAILKLVRGTDNRKNSQKRSPFRTWDAFEEEVSYIWRNASEFNEPGSAIVGEAENLKKYFLERLAELRRTVPEPPPPPPPPAPAPASVSTPEDTINSGTNGPTGVSAPGPGGTRLKLKMGGALPETPQRITLRLSGKNQNNEGPAEVATGEGAAPPKSEDHQPQEEVTETPRTRSLRERPQRAASQISTASAKDASPQRRTSTPLKHEPVTPATTNGAGLQPGTSGKTAQSQQQPQMSQQQQQLPPSSAAATTRTTTSAAHPAPVANSQTHIKALEGGNGNVSTVTATAPATPPVTTPAQAALEQFQNPQQTNAKSNRARKDSAYPLLSTVEVFTHPELHSHYHRKPAGSHYYRTALPSAAGADAPFHICIPPLKTVTQQSMTLTLPPSSHTLRIIPTIIPSNLHRQTNLSVTVGGQKLAPSSSGAIHQTQYSMPPPPPFQHHHQTQQQHATGGMYPSSGGTAVAPIEWAKPSYDIRLIPGSVTRIDMEIVGRNLAKTRGLTNRGGGMDHGEVDYESLTLFIHLLR